MKSIKRGCYICETDTDYLMREEGYLGCHKHGMKLKETGGDKIKKRGKLIGN